MIIHKLKFSLQSRLV